MICTSGSERQVMFLNAVISVVIMLETIFCCLSINRSVLLILNIAL